MTYDDKTNELYDYGVKGIKRVIRKDYSSVRKLYDKELYNGRTSNN